MTVKMVKNQAGQKQILLNLKKNYYFDFNFCNLWQRYGCWLISEVQKTCLSLYKAAISRSKSVNVFLRLNLPAQ